MEHADFTDVLRGGRFRREGETIAIELKKLGDLVVRSGRVTVCDPLAPSVVLDLARDVPKGKHPVEVAIAKIGKDQRVALGCVRFAKGDAVKWEMATAKGQNPKKLAPGEFYGYGVDAGTGCFVDTKASKKLDGEKIGDAILVAFRKTRVDTWAWTNMKVGDTNVVAFSSGYGDGFYGSYWGTSAKGDLVARVTDFGLMTEPIEETLLFPVKGPFSHPKMKAAGVAVTAVKGKALTLRVRGDARVTLATAKGKLVPASSDRKYTETAQTITFTPPPKAPADLHAAVTITLGFQPCARVK
jgi:hypothetical protein